MTGMDQHREDTAPLRRARAAAWIVALSMAGTTMTFQVYHSIKYGRMPWELAYLYGIVPLAIALCILEFVSVWDNAPVWAKPGAYVIMAGAMYLSAESTGAVVLHAAPDHMSWVFGILMDGAALLAVHFILDGPTAARAAAAIAEREAAAAQREAALRAELGALEQRLAATETAREGAARKAAETAERYAETEAARATLQTGLETAGAERDAAVSALQTAEQAAAEALARAEALAQKLAAVSALKPEKRPRKSAQAASRESAQGDDVTTELRALMELRADPKLWAPRMGGELARRLGVSGPTGRRFHSRFVRDGKFFDPFTERSGGDSDARSGERS